MTNPTSPVSSVSLGSGLRRKAAELVDLVRAAGRPHADLLRPCLSEPFMTRTSDTTPT